MPAGTYTLSWTGTATGRVYNSGATPPSYAASPVTFTADGTANVVVEFTASGATKTLSNVQFNAGTGTTWRLATPTLQTELAACQRYYQRSTGTASNTAYICSGVAISTTRVFLNYASPVTMRSAPSVAQSSASIGNGVISNQNITTIAYYSSGSLQQISLDVNVGSGLTQSGFFVLALPQNAYIELSAEL